MLRLRTTASLSALALLIGIAGSGWLSDLTDQWREPSDRLAMVRRAQVAPAQLSKAQRRHGPVRVVQPRRAGHGGNERTAQASASRVPVILQPVATPEDTSQRWDQLRGHLDGRVIVHVRIDGTGRVDGASVVASSGDPILDQHALRSVRGWRFAVPADHPEGLSGELPMRFSSQGRQLGML